MQMLVSSAAAVGHKLASSAPVAELRLGNGWTGLAVDALSQGRNLAGLAAGQDPARPARPMIVAWRVW